MWMMIYTKYIYLLNAKIEAHCINTVLQSTLKFSVWNNSMSINSSVVSQVIKKWGGEWVSLIGLSKFKQTITPTTNLRLSNGCLYYYILDENVVHIEQCWADFDKSRWRVEKDGGLLCHIKSLFLAKQTE